MRLFHAMKVLVMVLTLSTVVSMTTVPFEPRSIASAASPPSRRVGDPDTPEWTTPPPEPLRPVPSPGATSSQWHELLLRLFRVAGH